ncbi:MAG: DUF4281 domain-containing protein [Trueperaceae bacterium]|nr:DUF4281 domain-containing protein [Trueperaceae bacterium]
MAENLFGLINLLPMPIWLGMLLFPRTRFTQKMVMSYWPYMALAGIYLLFLIISLFSTGGSALSFSFNSLRTGLSAEWAFLAVWMHLLCFDLFTGVWIFRDAKYWGINPGIFLLVTLFLGPLGLGAYLFFRSRKSKNDPVRTLN